MSLNKFSSSTPVKPWMNIGCNSLKTTSLEVDSLTTGDILPITNITYDLGSTIKNWKTIYSEALKGLSNPVDANDAVNYQTTQNLIIKNAGILTESLTGNSFTYTGLNPVTTEYIFGGVGSYGLYGLGNLPASDLACYQYEYNFRSTGMFSTFIGYAKLFIGSGAVPVSNTTFVCSNNSDVNINGTFQIMSGYGTANTIIQSTINIYCEAGGVPQIQSKNYYYLLADTSINTNFVFKIEGTNAVGSATLIRNTGFVTNTFYPYINFP